VFGAAGWTLRALGSRRPTETGAAPAPPAAPAERPTHGRLVFQVHCARCHGPEGHGDGPDASALRPPPRDLTGAHWGTPATVESVRRTVRDGIPGTMMPALGAALSPGELDAVVAHVLAIAPDDAKQPLTPLLGAAGFTPAPALTAAPPLVATDREGKAVTLDRFRGEPVLIVFWGTSCAACVKELPELERLAARYRDRGLRVLPVCADEVDPAAVREVAAERAPGLPAYSDPTGTAKLAYDVQALPSAAIVDRDGRLLGRSQGSMRWSAPETHALLDAVVAARGASAP
jgi:mono/diheme cytochrome c family protein/peroxiredoxin